MKKTAALGLIIIFVAGIFFGPLTADKANAGFLDIFLNPGDAVLSLVSNAIYYIVWTPAAFLFGLTGKALNYSIFISVNSQMFRDLATGEGAVTTGWQLTRDVVNIFLIFVLLYIAIATILQISGYGTKELLAILIIVAFLVNFSLVITRMIIDASNILAMGFYEMFPAGGDGQADIAMSFRNAFDAEKIVTEAEEEKGVNSGESLYLKKIIVLLFGAALFIVAGFIFLVLSVLFLIRMVVLLILMVLAPLAFAAHTLPSTRKHASQWWNSLFSQSFFAPAALFMLWLSAGIANSSFVGTYVNTDATGIGDMIGTMIEAGAVGGQASGLTDFAKFFINYIIVIIFLCATVIIAKQMGAVGAEAASNMGQRARKAAQGYAGRVALRTAVARPISKIAKSETMEKFAAKYPIIGGASLRIAQTGAKLGGLEKIYERRAGLGMQMAEKQRAEYFKNSDKKTQEEMFKKMSAQQQAQLTNMMPQLRPIFNELLSRSSAKDKAGYGMQLGPVQKQTFFAEASRETQLEMFKQMSADERAEMATLAPNLNKEFGTFAQALSESERKKTMEARGELERKDIIKQLNNTSASLGTFASNIKKIKPDEAGKLDPAVFKDSAKLDEIVHQLGATHAQKILGREDEATKEFFTHLAGLGGSVEEIAKKLESVGNQSLAGWVKSGGAAKGVLESYGMPPSPPPSQSKSPDYRFKNQV